MDKYWRGGKICGPIKGSVALSNLLGSMAPMSPVSPPHFAYCDRLCRDVGWLVVGWPRSVITSRCFSISESPSPCHNLSHIRQPLNNITLQPPLPPQITVLKAQVYSSLDVFFQSRPTATSCVVQAPNQCDSCREGSWGGGFNPQLFGRPPVITRKYTTGGQCQPPPPYIQSS